MTASVGQTLTLFLVAGEESGDRLGASLMHALKRRLGDNIRFEGVGGRAMAQEGLRSLFPIDQLSIVGLAGIAKSLRAILRLIGQAADAAVSSQAQALVIIDSPEFTHRVARRVRARRPTMPIVDYVSPSVWAWRPWRARAMRGYIDHVLALLPFEPQAHRDLGGPPCTYVGHPLTEQFATLKPNDEERVHRAAAPPVLLVLPGSRRSEVRYHMPIFGETLQRLRASGLEFEAVLPMLPHLEEMVTRAAEQWSVQPRIVEGEADKRAAFRVARAALAKSGTVTLELALSGVPMVAAYRMSPFERVVASRVVTSHSAILANLVLGENVIPEFMLQYCTAENLAPALAAIMADGPARQQQLDAFVRVDALMTAGISSPSEKAADIVLQEIKNARDRNGGAR